MKERSIPIRHEVSAACEMLGFDPLDLANGRKLVCFNAQEEADQVLSVMKKTRYREGAAVIGAGTNGTNGRVLPKTAIGSTDIFDMLAGKCCQGFTESSALTRPSNTALGRELNLWSRF